MVKNGRLRFASFVINLVNAAIQSINFWISFLFYGGCI
jgi:hypothetical protein